MKTTRMTLFAALPLALIFALQATAQPADDKDSERDKAKAAAKLIEQGQLGLAAAVRLAEKRTGGHALDVSYRIEEPQPYPEPKPETPETPEPPETPKPDRPDRNDLQPSGKRLLFEVECIGKGDKRNRVTVDALTRKVTDVEAL